jgi:hypothetical protein
MQLSAQLSEAQEMMVCAAVGSPRKAAPSAHALEVRHHHGSQMLTTYIRCRLYAVVLISLHH